MLKKWNSVSTGLINLSVKKLMEAYLLPQNGVRLEKGASRSSTMDNARYIDSLRGHLDSGGVVSAHWTLL